MHQPVDGAVVLRDGEEEGDAGQDDEQVPREPAGDLVDLLVGGTLQHEHPDDEGRADAQRAHVDGQQGGDEEDRAEDQDGDELDGHGTHLGSSALRKCDVGHHAYQHVLVCPSSHGYRGIAIGCCPAAGWGRDVPHHGLERRHDRARDMTGHSARTGRHFLQIPGPTNVPDEVLRAISAPTIDHRGPEFAALGPRGARRARRRSSGRRARPGGWWSTPRRAPAPGRPRWSTRCPPATGCSPSRPGTSRPCGGRWPRRSGCGWTSSPGDWRHGADPAAAAERLAADTGARDQGRLRGAQRDVDRRDQPGRRDPRGARRGRPPGAAARRHHLLARVDRLPARRVGRRRHRRRLAEGPDAPARA